MTKSSIQVEYSIVSLVTKKEDKTIKKQKKNPEKYNRSEEDNVCEQTQILFFSVLFHY